MGFTLSMAPIRDAGSGCEAEIEALIRQVGGKFNDTITPCGLGFPFLDDAYESEDGGKDTAVILHEEVAWSWWDTMVKEVETDLGPAAVEVMSHMKAWCSAALPFDIPNQTIGDGSSAVGTHTAEHTGPPTNPLKTFLDKLLGKKHSPPPEVQNSINEMVDQYSGGTADCRLGSGPKILAELEAACNYWGLPDDEDEARQCAEDLYETCIEKDDTVPACYALMCRSFFRYAVPRGYIVWFVK